VGALYILSIHVEQKPGEHRNHQKQYIDQIANKYGFTQAALVRKPLHKDIKLASQIECQLQAWKLPLSDTETQSRTTVPRLEHSGKMSCYSAD
jgi:histidinol phosphatase-like enzyme